jgi:hypothetical protein
MKVPLVDTLPQRAVPAGRRSLAERCWWSVGGAGGLCFPRLEMASGEVGHIVRGSVGCATASSICEIHMGQTAGRRLLKVGRGDASGVDLSLWLFCYRDLGSCWVELWCL